MFEFSISNIAWDCSMDDSVYELMSMYQYSGIEIAPSKLFPNNTYSRLAEASLWASELKRCYGIEVVSLQSIWFGRNENMFSSEFERKELFEYTKKSIQFANCVGARNVVFGCPKNRNIPDGIDRDKAYDTAVLFFRKLGEYAEMNKTTIGFEANPILYNTNFINNTSDAFRLALDVGTKGFKVNLDIGTMIYNDEDVDALNGEVDWINHVHVSEPGLKMIKERKLHGKIAELLHGFGYSKYVSIEMNDELGLDSIASVMSYVKGSFI